MEAPDKIYLQVCGDCPLDRVGCEKCRFVELGEVTWSEEKIFDKDVEYIRKEALLGWAKENLLECEVSNDEADYGRIDAYKKLIDKLNSM